MPIGDPITQPIPAVGEAGTSYATKFVNFLTEVKTRLEAKVPLASLLAGLFDLANNPIGNAKYLGLYEQVSSPTTPVGCLQRYGGELYYVSPSGAVRITNAGNLDVVGANGITGDYAAPAEFKYVLASTQFQALSDVGTTPDTWAYVGARAFDVYGGATSANRVRVSWGGSTSYTLTLPPALPSANTTVYLDNTGALTTTKPSLVLSLNTNFAGIVQNWSTINGGYLTSTAGAQSIAKLPIPLPVGAVITGYTLYANKTSGSGISLTSQLGNVSGTDGSATDSTPGTGTETNAANAPGAITLSKTGLTHTVTAGKSPMLTIYNSASSTGEKIFHAEVTYTPPI